MEKWTVGPVIKELREGLGMTQADLAQRIGVSDKAVSKWETGKGYPDITLLDPLAAALGVSVAELLSGCAVVNTNTSGNMLRSRFYACPICGNVITAVGEAHVSCHGISLPPLEADPADDRHSAQVEMVDGELFVHSDHPMSKEHHLTFMAAVSTERVQFVRLYPEGPAQARFMRSMVREVYLFCNRDGLFKVNVAKALKRS